jgi:hypothetical protein
MACVFFDFASKRVGTMAPGTAPTAAHTDLKTDKVYLVDGTLLLPLFSAGPLVGVYRSSRFVIDSFATFGWLRIDGPVTSAVVRVYGDGQLIHTTPAITDNNPVRLPAGRYREWDVEVESASRLTQVILTTTSGEMSAS